MITINKLRPYLIDRQEGLMLWSDKLLRFTGVMMNLDRDLKLRLIACRNRRKSLIGKDLREG